MLRDGGGVKVEALIDERCTDSFRVTGITLTGGAYLLDRSAAVYVVIEGDGELTGDGYRRDVRKGDYFFLPAAAAGRFAARGNMKLVECRA